MWDRKTARGLTKRRRSGEEVGVEKSRHLQERAKARKATRKSNTYTRKARLKVEGCVDGLLPTSKSTAVGACTDQSWSHMTAWKRGETEKEVWRLTPVIGWVRFPHIASAIRFVFIAYQCAPSRSPPCGVGRSGKFQELQHIMILSFRKVNRKAKQRTLK
jgi:hypothetical protein